MLTTTTTTPSYKYMEELQLRKEELRKSIQGERQKIGELWHGLTSPQPASSKGELVTNIITNSITAIDAFLLMRKLMKIYGNFFHKTKKKKR